MRVGSWVLLVLVVLFFMVVLTPGCDETSQPSTVQTIVLKGSPYDRGLQHGKAFKPYIRSLYTRLLTNSIVPYLNREQLNIAPVLNKYNDPQYQGGQFSAQMLLESGRYMKDKAIPEEYVDEIRGIADGAEMEFDEILSLNTFFDTMMSFRSIVLFIQNIQHPYIQSLSFGEELDSDGFDNDGNGDTDEAGDNRMDVYVSTPYAVMLEVEPDAAIRFVIDDPALLGLACIDLRNTPPHGEMTVERSCVEESCISPDPECQTADPVPLDCLDVRYMDPECSAEACMDLACAQVEEFPACFDNACIQPGANGDCPNMTLEASCYTDGCMEKECYPSLSTPECYDEKCYSEKCQEIRRGVCLFPRVGSDCLKTECVEISDPSCVNPESLRIYVNDTLYAHGDGSITTRLLDPVEGKTQVSDCDAPLEVIFQPPEGFEPASAVSITLQTGDLAPVYSPEPFHHRNMRDERFVFTTKGYAEAHGTGHKVWEVPNKGVELSGKMPTSLAFGARNKATKDGKPLLAHHFGLLDNDMMHEHSALFFIVPEKGYPYALVGYTGIAWGFSGMNTEGLTYAFNPSDSLDNSLVGRVMAEMFKPENLMILLENPDLEGLSKVLREIRLLPDGVPIGIALREMLKNNKTADDGLAYLYDQPRTYGWNALLADAAGELIAVEMDGATQGVKSGTLTNEDGFYYYRPDASDPENVDTHGRLYSSITPDDIRIASHFRKNTADMEPIIIMGVFSPKAQPEWTGFYFRSLRTYYMLGEVMEAYIGTPDDDRAIDVDLAIEMLRTPELVDTRDSMNACVYEPAVGLMHCGMGGVPATDQPFIAYDLAATIAGEVSP
jgi:hypothetical protein